MDQLNFDQYFKSGFTETIEFGEQKYPITFRSIFAGNLHTEKKIAFQGKLFPKEDLKQSVFPIDFALAKNELFQKFNPSNLELVSHIRIICKETTPISWLPAFEDTEKTEVRVDGGYINIAHPQYVEVMKAIKKQHPEIEEFADIVKLAFDPNTNPPIQFETLEDTGYSTFRKINEYESMDIESGFGDGTYTVYKGLDEEGDVCRLVCDLKVNDLTNWGKYFFS